MSRWVLVDDTDPEIRWTGLWFNDQGSQDKLGNFGLPYEDTLHGINSNGSFSYTFQGTKVLITGTVQHPSGSNTPSPSWVCTVDEITIPSNLNQPTAENRLDLCETDSLNDGSHNITVQVTVSEQKTFWFDYIQYFPSPSTNLDNAALSIDSSDSHLDYKGVWKAYFPGSITSQTGSNVTFGFRGVSLTWLGFYDNKLPLSPTTATYSIDGQSPIAFDLDGTNAQTTRVQYNQKFFQTPQLTSGNHTIQVVYQGNTQTAPLSLYILEVQGGTTTNNTAGSPTGSSAAPVVTAPSAITSGTNSASASSKNTGAIIGGSLGGPALFVALLVTFLFWRHRKRRLEVGKYGDGIMDPSAMTQPTPFRGYDSLPFHHINHSGPEFIPSRWGEITSSPEIATTGMNPYGNVTRPSSNNVADQNATSSTTIADVCSSPSNGQVFGTQAHTASAGLSHPRVVRGEDSRLEFPWNVESEQAEVLPPDYTPA